MENVDRHSLFIHLCTEPDRGEVHSQTRILSGAHDGLLLLFILFYYFQTSVSGWKCHKLNNEICELRIVTELRLPVNQAITLCTLKPDADLCMHLDLPLNRKTVENQDWAIRPPGRGGPRTAGRRAVVGRGPLGLRGPWASGRGPAFSKTRWNPH